MSTLNDIDTGTPMEGASVASMASELRGLKLVVKNLLLNSHNNDGSLKTISISGLAPNSVGADQLSDLSVTAAALAANSVTNFKIANGAVTADKLAVGAIASASIGNGTITASKLANNSVLNIHLGEPVNGTKILSDSAVDANRAIGTNHLKNLSVVDRVVKDVAVSKLTGGADDQFLYKVAGAWVGVSAGGGLTYNAGTGQFDVASQLKIATFGDAKARGSNGGAATANTWVTRDLGQFADTEDIMIFSGNTFRLDVGLYLFVARVPAVGVERHQARLYVDHGDATNEIILWGGSMVAPVGSGGADLSQSVSEISGTFEVTSADWVFEIQHWCQNTVGATDFGEAASSDNTVVYGNHVELYTNGYVVKIG